MAASNGNEAKAAVHLESLRSTVAGSRRPLASPSSMLHGSYCLAAYLAYLMPDPTLVSGWSAGAGGKLWQKNAAIGGSTHATSGPHSPCFKENLDRTERAWYDSGIGQAAK